MKNNTFDNKMKRILLDGIHKLPSDDFNDKLLERYLSEQVQGALKPGINNTVLLISASLILFFTGLVFYLHTMPAKYIPYVPDIENVSDKIHIVILMIVSFSIFNVVSDILEDRNKMNMRLNK